MARERYLLHVTEEDLKPSESIGAPRTPREKWDNYWYHYKFQTLIGTFIAVVLVLFVVQIFTKEKYDYTVTVVSDNGLAPNTLDLLKAELQPFGTDVDGNGEVSLLMDGVTLKATGIGMSDGYDGYQKLMTEIGSGDFALFLVETDIYDRLLKEDLEAVGDFFCDIDTASGKTERFKWNAKYAIKDAELMQVWFTEDFVWFVRDGRGDKTDAHLKLLQAYVAAYEQNNA